MTKQVNSFSDSPKNDWTCLAVNHFFAVGCNRWWKHRRNTSISPVASRCQIPIGGWSSSRLFLRGYISITLPIYKIYITNMGSLRSGISEWGNRLGKINWDFLPPFYLRRIWLRDQGWTSFRKLAKLTLAWYSCLVAAFPGRKGGA